jgi:hypothetical protein
MITSCIELNNLHVKLVNRIEVNHVASEPLQDIWQWHQHKKESSFLNYADGDNISCSDGKEVYDS